MDLDFAISAHMLIVFVCIIAVKNKDSAFCYNIRLEINMINICSILVLPGDEQIIYTFTTSTTMILWQAVWEILALITKFHNFLLIEIENRGLRTEGFLQSETKQQFMMRYWL